MPDNHPHSYPIPKPTPVELQLSLSSESARSSDLATDSCSQRIQAAMSGAAGPHPDCCQVIDSEGGFQEEGLSQFVQQQGVIDARTNYQVVAIMGPQSSGKSTLMNHVVSRASAEA